jgi:hypothetical protein
MIVLCPQDEYSRPLLWFKLTLVTMGFQYSTSMVGAVDLQGLDLRRVDLKKIVEPLSITLLVLDDTELCYDTLTAVDFSRIDKVLVRSTNLSHSEVEQLRMMNPDTVFIDEEG